MLGFALPLYLAMRGGGYEAVLRDQVGVALWWVLLTGVLVGALPIARPSRAQLIALGSLVALAAWTGIGALWSQSSGRTVEELSRLSCYAAALALGIATVRAGTRTALMGGVACAIGSVAMLALLSRLHPAWFPANETAAFLTGTQSRLNYPLNYWNALAAMTAIGVPLIAHFALASRRVAVRMLSASALPAMAAVVYLTFSRGGWIELGVAAAVLIAFSGERIWRVLTLALAGAGGALLIAAIHQRPAIDRGLLSTAAARHSGDQLIAVALVVCAGVGLLAGALALLERYVQAGRAMAPARTDGLPRRATAKGALAVALACAGLVGFLARGGPHTLSHAWQTFKNPTVNVVASQRNSEGRLLALSGNGRYQYWASALHAFESDPLRGIGAGTFQFWWAAHGSIFSYVVNAHSLYFETLAETGAIGFGLLIALLAAALLGTLKRSLRASAVVRSRQAAIAASLAAFLAAAAVDWVWQVPAIPVAALLLAGAGLAREPDGRRGAAVRVAGSIAGPDEAAPRGSRAKPAWTALAALGIAAIAVPMLTALSLRESQAQANGGRLPAALSSARGAHGFEPYAAEPSLQQALVLEQARKLTAAARQAARATSAAQTDWRAWLVRSRIEAERGDYPAALAAWESARSLDPHDPLFARS